MESIYRRLVKRLTSSHIIFTTSKDDVGCYININQPTTSGRVTRSRIVLTIQGLYYVESFLADGQTEYQMFTSLKTANGRLELRDGSIVIITIE